MKKLYVIEKCMEWEDYEKGMLPEMIFTTSWLKMKIESHKRKSPYAHDWDFIDTYTLKNESELKWYFAEYTDFQDKEKYTMKVV